MLSPEIRHQIKWLYFGERLNVRRIAVMLDLSRWTVAHVINTECQPPCARARRIEVVP